jgi:hypothetical protein
LLLLKARKYLIAHSTGTVKTTKTMMGRQKKTGKPVSPQQKISYRNQRGMKKTDTQIQTPTK